MAFNINTAKVIQEEPNKKSRFNISTAKVLSGSDITNIYDTQQIGAKLMSGAVTPKESTGTNFLQESILKPSMSFQGGQLKSAANFADTIDHYATKIADIMGTPETSQGEVFSLRKNKILNYLKDNWNTLGDTMITKGVTPGVLQKIYEGIGSASVEVPKLMTMGKYALPISGALEGGKTGGAEGMVKGAIEGLAMKGAIGSMVNLPNAVAIPAGGVALGGVPSAIQELQKPKEERDWSKPIADTVVMGALSAGGNRPTMEQFNLTRNMRKLDVAMKKQFEKGVRPSSRNINTVGKAQAYTNKAIEGVKTIAANKGNLNIVDENGEPTKSLPKNLNEFSQAIDQTKKQIFNQYDTMQKQAGEKGALVELEPVVKELQTVIDNPVMQDLHPEITSYAQKISDSLNSRVYYDTQTAQNAIETLNQSLKAFYRNPSYETASKAAVDAMIANKLRVGLDNSIEGATGEKYQSLKNQYGALKTIEKDVVHRAIVDARKNNKGLLDFSDIATGVELVQALATQNPLSLAKAGTIKGISMYYKYLNNPNTSIKNLFNTAEKAIQTQNVKPYQNKPIENPFNLKNIGLTIEDISKKPEQSLIETKGIPTTVPDKVKKLLQKNVSIIETGSNFQLTKAMSVKDIHGNSIDLKGGEVFTPYKLSNNQVWIHDGKDVIINKNQFQNLENQSIKGGVEFAPEMKGITESQLGGSKWQDNNLISNDETVATLVKNEDGTWSYQSDFSEGTDIFKSKVEAMKQAENDTLGQYSGRETKFSQYTLPGGENYREVLIKSPVGKPEQQKFRLEKISGEKPYKIYEGNNTEHMQSFATEEQARKQLDKLNSANFIKTPIGFQSSHFDEPNILTHLRINDRKTINNKKVLFVEELQSDWATEGRKKGFSDTSKKQIFSTKQEPNGEWSVVNQDGNTIITAGTKEYAERASMEYNKSGLPANLQDSRIGVPSHPLLKNWQTLALKKALKEAVDKNYDYLSWTTGAQQADRYNLAKQVDSVHYAKRENGTFDLYAVKKGSSENTKIATAIQKEKLDEYVGKNLSEKIIKGEGQDVPNTPYVKLSGEDLTIGGEWAKNLYDKQIPNILKDLTGQDVQVIKLKGIQGKHWKVWASNNPATEQPEIIRDYATAKQYMDSGYKVKEFSGDNLPQQAIKITPQIKAIIKGELKKQPSGKLPSIWEEIAKGYNKQPEENIPKFIKARIK